MIAKRYRVSFWGEENVLKLCWWLHISMNIPKTMKLYTLNGSIIWYVSYISVKLLNFFLKSRSQWNWQPKGICCCSTTKLCPTLCDLMDCSMPDFLVLHYLLEFAQIYVHWVDDAIQSSHPLSPSSPPALHLSQHQGLFQWVGSSHQMAKVL